MTIDEAIEYFKNKTVVLTEEEALANTLALETMRKYQQIQEIVNTWRHDITAGDYHCMAEVVEVVEDGNDD